MTVRPTILIAVSLLMPAQAASAQSADMLAALQLEAAARWPEAAAAFAPLASANPFDGAPHYHLGFNLSRAGQCSRAEPELEQAIRLGVTGFSRGMRSAHVLLASCAAERGDTLAALAQLDSARRIGLRDFSQINTGPRFAALQGNARYRAMAGLPPTPLTDRVARWRYDLAWLDRLIRETHPFPFRVITEPSWSAAVARIDARLPTATDDEIIALMMQLVAGVGDGHTALYPPFSGPGAWRLLPIWPVSLRDGWYVGAAAAEYRALVGGRITGAGSRPIEFLDSLARTVTAADNAWTVRWLGQVPLQVAQFYALAGAANDDGSVTLHVELANGQRSEVSVVAREPDRDPSARWAPPEWPAMITGPAAPRWLRYASRGSAIEWLPRERVLYVALNAVDDSLPALGEAVLEALRVHRADGVVLDLRLNNGGDGSLAPVFVKALVRSAMPDEHGAFQVLIGPRTFSAATMLLKELARYTEAETVGWPTGGRPVHIGSEVPFRLPMSGLAGSTAARLEVAGWDADDARPFFPPWIVAWPSGAELRAGADPVLDAALARIAGRPRS